MKLFETLCYSIAMLMEGILTELCLTSLGPMETLTLNIIEKQTQNENSKQ